MITLNETAYPTRVHILKRRIHAPGIAAIVPAHNEAERIGDVIRVLCQVGIINEIIVVDDGSEDSTIDSAQQSACGDKRLRMLRLPVNKGKGQAVFTGWSATQAAYLLLLDADLINLQVYHVEQLLKPLLDGEADMTLGLFRHGYWRTDLSHRLTPWLTGQRCLHASMLNFISHRAAAGYGLETALNLAARQYSWRCQRVPLVGVSHPVGEILPGGRHGLGGKIKMYAHVLRAWLLSGDRF